MEVIKYDELKRTWKQIARDNTGDNFNFELEVHKKLLNIFHPGEYYYFVFNCSEARMELVHSSIKSILGINPEDFSVELLLQIIHPEDLPYFVDFEKRVTDFFTSLPPEKVLKYKVSYDYRVRRADGKYIRILQQATTIQTDENGAVIRAIDVHTDITHLKKENGSTLSFIGLDGEPSYNHVLEGKIVKVNPVDSVLTKREKIILNLLIAGKSSKQIAQDLYISKYTVDTHRRNMLKKTNTSSIYELVLKYMQNR